MIKRAYAPASPADGIRVLVDRLWPRGVSKAGANFTFWMKDIAPSPKLRVWFGHKPERFKEFAGRYKKELTGNPRVDELRKLARGRVVTLVYGARDPEVNHALVLRSLLRRRS
ncbi:MAG TPA: DUF488 family protein [Steroidobacteraceae bacterium]|nr:DUF488 family protein [Steroidobacteraceae bacterium]